MKKFFPLTIVGVCCLSLLSCAMPGDSIGNDRPWMPVPAPPIAPPISSDFPMMEDPEAEVTESMVEVWAKDAAEAAKKCQQIADNWTAEGGSLVTVQGNPRKATSRPTKNGEYKYVCTLRGES